MAQVSSPSSSPFPLLPESLGAGLLILDAQGEIQYANTEAQALLGLQPGQSHYFDSEWLAVDENYQPFTTQTNPFRQVIATRQPLANRVLGVFRHQQKQPIWVMLSLTPQLDAQGIVAQVVCLFVDVTQRQHTTRTLAAESQLLKALLHNLPDMVYIKDAASRYVRVNEAQMRFMGIKTPEEAVGNTDFDFHAPALAQPAYDEEAEIVRSGQPLINRIFAHESKAQEPRWYSVTKVPLFDESGSVMGIFGITRDITDSYLAEQSLKRRDIILSVVNYVAEHLLKVADWRSAIEEVLRVLGTATRVSRVYVFENHQDAAGRLLTSQRFEWTAKGIEPKLDAPEFQNLPYSLGGFSRWREMLSEGKAIFGTVSSFPSSERRLLDPHRIFSLAVMPIFVQDEWLGFIGFDVCKRNYTWHSAELEALQTVAKTLGAAIAREENERQARELAREKERSEVLKQFINDASHDLRTPLSIIMMTLYTMHEQAEASPQLPEKLGLLEQQAERLNRLLTNMLEMSSLDMDTAQQQQRINLPELLQLILQKARPAASQKQQQLQYHSTMERLIIHANPPHLSHAISNLVDNALHFTPIGGTVDLRLRADARHIYIDVRDNGVGIHPEDIPFIFDRFYRVDKARNTRTGGSGLGLAISKKIVENHGGKIEVVSKVGKGSVFTITLPRNTAT